jgi:hypothetical protein
MYATTWYEKSLGSQPFTLKKEHPLYTTNNIVFFFSYFAGFFFICCCFYTLLDLLTIKIGDGIANCSKIIDMAIY